MSMIDASMINVSISKDEEMSLREYIENSTTNAENIPLRLFGEGVNTVNIEKAIQFLEDNNGGSIVIPKTGELNKTKIEIIVKAENNSSKITYYDNKPPHINFKRPYIGGDWEVGDIINNTDSVSSITGNVCSGWVCTESGNPGSWMEFGVTDYKQLKREILKEVNKIIYLAVSKEDWNIGTDGVYYKRIDNSSILKEDNLRMQLMDSSNEAKEEFNSITSGVTGDGYIELYSTKIPSIDFNIVLLSAFSAPISGLVLEEDIDNIWKELNS